MVRFLLPIENEAFDKYMKVLEKEKMEEVTGMRTFQNGATRQSDNGKLDFEGFLSPTVLLRYAEYLHEHRFQADGKLRDSDNWQKGIPKDVYMKSLWRHFENLWLMHRGHGSAESIEDALCAVMFNTMGYLYETQRKEIK